MFMIFGLVTVLFGISLWWILPDSPLTAKFLTDRERIIAIERLKSNKTGVKNTHHKKSQIKEAFLDPKIWIIVAAVFFHNMTNPLQTNFTGLIIVGFGYSSYDAVLLSIPPGIVQAVGMILVSFFLSTRWGEGKRILLIILCYIPGIAACLILYLSPITPSTKSLHLFAVIIVPIVAVSSGVLYSLLASNVAGYTKKTVAGAIFFSAYCVSNIVAPQTFLAREAPTYSTGVAVTLTAFCLNIVLFSVLYVVYYRANKSRDNDPAGQQSVDATRDLIDAFSDMTDLENKTLRYKL
jgi:ACS family allantoate permease-like MFS transporter